MRNLKNKLSITIMSFMLFGVVACSDGNGSSSDRIDTTNSDSNTNRAVEDGTNFTTNNSNHMDNNVNSTNNTMTNQRSETQNNSTMNNTPGVNPNLADPNGTGKFSY